MTTRRRKTDQNGVREPRGEQRRSRTMGRRGFFARISGATALAALSPGIDAEKLTTPLSPGSVLPRQLSDRQWQTLVAVQDHLFPSATDSPGAREINAMTYLDAALADPKLDPAEADFIKNGIGWLEEIARETQNGSFLSLSAEKREAVLQALNETGRGENWIATILMYIFEALLSDPAYGGNPGGIGWKWLGHDPGFPRPPADKIYGKL